MDGDGLCVSVSSVDSTRFDANITSHGSMLGSLTLYRRILLENVFSDPGLRPYIPFTSSQPDLKTLPTFGHGIAGVMSGMTVSMVAAPVEHIKARLQVQYAADKSKRMYSGPIDCTRKIVSFGATWTKWIDC